MDAWADGLNYFLATHPEVAPRVIMRFEPWMALSFSEGSIGGDVERIDLSALAAFYGGASPPTAMSELLREPSGSNGFAIAPSNTANHHALLLINPHTSFYFRNLDEFRWMMSLYANSSNNTIYADADGQIAYFHPQFVPRRDDRFDWTQPVDGSDPATEWHGIHGIDEVPHVVNPPNGWVMNTNNWPYSAAGPYSPKREDFPRYMDTHGENPRGIHATRVLENRKDFTLESLRDAAFDSYLPAFAALIPQLLAAYDATPDATLADQIALLRAWDDRWSAGSVATSLAVYWGQELWQQVNASSASELARATPAQRLAALAAASARLATDFGTWRVPWGDINRFQRTSDDIVATFDDAAPSIPIPFTSAQWGSLASFGARTYPGTKRMYGTFGNSFVAVVEFGPQVRARAITAGGESGHPGAPHFSDEAERYASGDLRDVYFAPTQLVGHTERTYHPGQP